MKRAKLKEFSKKVIVALAVIWFIGAILGASVVIVQVVRGDYTVNLSDLLMYIGAPMTGGIVSYMLKSAFENKEKIKKNKTEVSDYESQTEINFP